MAHTLLPSPSAGAIQGPTIQPWYIYPTNQPELRAYANAAHRLRHIVPVVPRFEGATVTRTDPIPPVSNPLFNYFFRDVNRVTDARLRGSTWQYEGAKVEQEYIFPVSQPEMNRYEALKQGWRHIVASARLFEGVVPTQNLWYATSNPLFNYYFRDVNRLTDARLQGESWQYEGATVQQEYIFPVSQPELLRYARAHALRFIVDAIPRLETIQYIEIYPTKQPELNRFAMIKDSSRNMPAVTPRLEGATVQQKYDFPTNQPELSRFAVPIHSLRNMPMPVPRLEGATVMPTYEFFPNQPEQNRIALLRNALRFIVDAKPRFEGSTIQQEYIFPVGSPDFARYDRVNQAWRYIVAAKERLEGATIQQEYIFPVGSPDFARYDIPRQGWRYIVAAPPQLHQGATIQDIEMYFPNQPELNRFRALRESSRNMPAPMPRFETIQDIEMYFPNQADQAAYAVVAQRNRRIVDAKPRFEGATIQPGYIFPVSQPEMVAYSRLQRLRFIVAARERFDGIEPISAFGLLIGVTRISKIGQGTRKKVVGVQRNTHIGTGTSRRIK